MRIRQNLRLFDGLEITLCRELPQGLVSATPQPSGILDPVSARERDAVFVLIHSPLVGPDDLVAGRTAVMLRKPGRRDLPGVARRALGGFASCFASNRRRRMRSLRAARSVSRALGDALELGQAVRLTVP